MSYKIAGIDVHKKMLAVVVSDVEIESEYQFERRMFSSNPEQLRSLAAWLVEQEAEEVVMESTAQYWKPVWEGYRKILECRRLVRNSPSSAEAHTTARPALDAGYAPGEIRTRSRESLPRRSG